jgi:hypothetical protein
VGPRTGLDVMEKRIELRFLGGAVCSLVAILTKIKYAFYKGTTFSE